MELDLIDINGRELEINTNDISSIDNMYDDNGDTTNSVMTLGKFKRITGVCESIQDIILQVWHNGYNQCIDDLKEAEENEKPELRGYIVSENGEYVNVNHIASFKALSAEKTKAYSIMSND